MFDLMALELCPKELPVVIAWGIWLTRNSGLFEGRCPLPQLCASWCLSIDPN